MAVTTPFGFGGSATLKSGTAFGLFMPAVVSKMPNCATQGCTGFAPAHGRVLLKS